MKIKDIKYKDYLKLEDRSEYDFFIKYWELEPFDFLEIGEFESKSFSFVKVLQHARSSAFTFEKYLQTISELERLSSEWLLEQSLFKLIQSYDYCVKQIDAISEKERNNLVTPTDNVDIAASEGLFDGMSIFIQQDNFAGGDPLKYEAVGKLPYHVYFAKAKLEVDRSIFQKERSRLLKEKNK